MKVRSVEEEERWRCGWAWWKPSFVLTDSSSLDVNCFQRLKRRSFGLSYVLFEAHGTGEELNT